MLTILIDVIVMYTLKVNPDYVATPVAASNGDVRSLSCTYVAFITFKFLVSYAGS
jgi:cation transporter-like permease